MGWSTELMCAISFNKETYNDKYQVLNRIDELENCIQIAEDEIRNLVIMTEPKKFCNKEEDPLCWIYNTYRDNIKLIKEYTVELYKLNLLLDNWDACHNENGFAIRYPENIHWNSAFLEGDFIEHE